MLFFSLAARFVLGFSYRICVEEGFEELPFSRKLAEFVKFDHSPPCWRFNLAPGPLSQIAVGGGSVRKINQHVSFHACP